MQSQCLLNEVEQELFDIFYKIGIKHIEIKKPSIIISVSFARTNKNNLYSVAACKRCKKINHFSVFNLSLSLLK